MRYKLAFVVLPILISASALAQVQSDAHRITDPATYMPDNTGTNVRDRDPNAVTADEQSDAKEHTALAAKIRKAIVNEDGLSTYAKNVKVIVDKEGVVTLRGPVKNDGERATIERIAREVVNETAPIESELEIAAKGDKK